jgi:uncharacterized protein YbjT (DUF2867 family)
LAASGVGIAAGDMDDRASLERAMRGVHGVYSVRDFWSCGAAREVRQGINVADAAAAACVAHLVFSSVGGAERNSGIDHWQTKWEIEQHIRALGLPATMLRPAAFMENYYIPAVEKALLKGRLLDPVRADTPYQTIATDDIGKFAALAFEQPDHFIGIALEIAGSELTNQAAAGVFSQVHGRRVKFRRLPMPVVRVALGREFYQMFRWFNHGGFQAGGVFTLLSGACIRRRQRRSRAAVRPGAVLRAALQYLALTLGRRGWDPATREPGGGTPVAVSGGGRVVNGGPVTFARAARGRVPPDITGPGAAVTIVA